MRAALELGCCPQSPVWAEGIWKMVYTVRAPNMGQQEYLVEISSAYPPGMSKILRLNSYFDKLLWFQ